MKGRDGFVSEHVVNLSDSVLSMAEIKVLSKDLNFYLTPGEINRFELNKDLHEFARRMKCKAYLRKYGEGSLDRKDMRFKCKSKWMPDVVDPALSLFLENIERGILSINEGGCNYSNLDKEERKALKDLKSYEDIVIKSTDKGSAVVVWGREDY